MHHYPSKKCLYIVATCFCFLTVYIFSPPHAETAENQENVRVEGNGCFTYGDDDSPSSAKKRAVTIAKRNAIESYKVFISSSSTVKNFELEEDVVNTLASGYMYEAKTIEVTEQGREICVTVEGYIKPDEIETIVAEREKRLSQPMGEEITGEWYAYMESPSKSSLSYDENHNPIWTYSVPEVDVDTWAGLNLTIHPVSMKDRMAYLSIVAQTGYPIYIRFYSFTPGFSKEDDDLTFIPVEKLIHIKPGSQELLIDPSRLFVPEWWREETGVPKDVIFTPDNVRIIEFDAEVDEELGPVSDTIVIKSIVLQ